MVKTFIKIRKFKSIGPRRRRFRRILKQRLQKKKAKSRQKSPEKKDLNNQSHQMNISPAVFSPHDILSKFSPDRINFLFSEGDNAINQYFEKENEEFIPYIPLAITDPGIITKRHKALYGLFDIIKQIITSTGFKFPLDLEQKVIALYDYFLANVNNQKEMKISYLARTLFACVSIYDKEEGLNVFVNEKFQNFFTTDDEIDVLEAVDFNLNPIKPYDYFTHFCFNAQVSKRGDIMFLNYLEILKKKFKEIAIILLFNEESRNNRPSVNYVSIFKMAYDATKKLLPNDDNFINDYLTRFQNIIHYSNENYLLAKTQIEKSRSIFEEFKSKYTH